MSSSFTWANCGRLTPNLRRVCLRFLPLLGIYSKARSTVTEKLSRLHETAMSNSTSSNGTGGSGHLLLGNPNKTVEMVFIIFVAGSLSLVTMTGNILVMLSVKVNKNLQTVNNYFVFSLACADMIIGLCSMNLYTVYIVIGYWPMGPVICDLWLALDYVVSNASVMNLLIISFDRYFCVTKPLSYPVKRTTKMAGIMIAAAWILSFVLWAPAILFWQFLVGGRTVPEKECHIQFFSNAAVTFGTAIAAFYLPVIIMIVLYWQISKVSKSRVKEKCKPSRAHREFMCNNYQQAHIARSNKNKVEEDIYRNRTQNIVDSSKHNNVSYKFEDLSMTHCENHMEDRGIKKCVSDEEKECSHDCLSVSHVPSNLKNPETVMLSKTFNRVPSHCLDMESKLSCIKEHVCTASSSTLEIASEVQQQNPAAQTDVRITKEPLKKKKLMPSRERKVTRTIMAILVAFVVTWTPYNVMVLINTFCTNCIPKKVWTIGYWLCYINSTVNPACYALCNVTFKNTFKHLILCQYKNIRSAR